MARRGGNVCEVGNHKAVDQQLEATEWALNAGDLVAAGDHLDAVQRTTGGAGLTGQETTTLRLLPDGPLSQKDIARAMDDTHNTLKTHLKSPDLKLGMHCRSEAIRRAGEVGLLPRPISFAALPTDGLVEVV